MRRQEIRITKAKKDNWYKKGETYYILDAYKYQPLGVQVVREGNGRVPDVVENGHFTIIYEGDNE